MAAQVWLRKSDLERFAGSTTARKALASKLWTVLAGKTQEAMTRDGHPPLKMRPILAPNKDWVPVNLTLQEYEGGMEVEKGSLLQAYDRGWIRSGMAPGYAAAVHQLFVDWMQHLK